MEATIDFRITRIVPLLIAACHCERSAAIKTRLFVAMAVFLLTLVAFPAYAKYGGGSGTAEDPYKIATAEHLILLGETREDYDKHFILTADIDLAGHVFDKAVIAPAQLSNMGGPLGTAFTGVFDGNNHTISHMAIKGASYLALFGYMASGAVVKNIGLVDVNVMGSRSIGGLVGCSSLSHVTQCYSTGSVTGDGYSIGGLVGENWGRIGASYSTAGVSGTREVGGLVGTSGGSVFRCYTIAAVTGAGWGAGGLVGDNRGDVTQCYSAGSVSGSLSVGGLVGGSLGHVTQCYSTGTVSGESSVGGLVGSNNYEGSITTSYSTGQIRGDNDVGGLVGSRSSSAIVIDSFWDTQASGQTTSAGGTGLSTAEMQDIRTYLAAGWDLVGEIANGTWEIWQVPPTGGYPVLTAFSGYMPLRLEGAGTPDDPYLISNAQELGAMVHYSPYACYRLAASVDLSGVCWVMAVVPWFAGTFDGNNLTISHLTMTGSNALGLFGELTSGAEVKDLGLVDVNVAGSGYGIGGLARYNGGSVTGCYSTGAVSGDGGVGGLVGGNEGCVTDCYSSGTVTGGGCAGGLVGENYRFASIFTSYSTTVVSGQDGVGGLVGGNAGAVTQCYSSGPVSGSGPYVGGLAGSNAIDATVAQCYSTGAVDGNDCVGGLVGDNSGTVAQCYGTGSVSGKSSVGGLAGLNAGNISSCYSTADVGGEKHVGGLVGFNSWGGMWSPKGTVANCYSAGIVLGDEYVGGLVGEGDVNDVVASFWDIETSGQQMSAGGTGLITAEMQMAVTFLNAGLPDAPGWDFVGETENGTQDIWAICEGVDYPHLAWEFVIGDFDADADTDFADFCILAEHWLAADGSFWCGQGCDLTNDGSVNWQDLIVFAQNWLTAMAP